MIEVMVSAALNFAHLTIFRGDTFAHCTHTHCARENLSMTAYCCRYQVMGHEGAERLFNKIVHGGKKGERPTQQQEREAIKKLFDEIDKDGSGVLSPDVLREFMAEIALTPEEIEEFFRSLSLSPLLTLVAPGTETLSLQLFSLFPPWLIAQANEDWEMFRVLSLPVPSLGYEFLLKTALEGLGK